MFRRTLFCVLVVLLAWPVMALAQTKYRYPMTTSGTYITAYYDVNRTKGPLKDWNGGSKTYDNHTGSDYGVGGFSGMDKGFWIVAAASGTVVTAVDGQADRCTTGKCSPCEGNYVKIKHSDGMHTYYLHMKKGTLQVKVGQTVKCGDRLGQVGSSGCSTGPHLHFQVNTSATYSAHQCPFVKKNWVSPGSYLGHPSTTCQGGNPPPPPPPPTGCTHVKPARLGGVGLNIRSTSSTSGSIVGSVPEGKCLQVLQKTTSGQSISGNTTWYKISYNGVTGWISGYYADCSDCGGPAPECTDGQSRSCYTGPSGTKGVGICKAGTQKCASGKWGSCSGQVRPGSESCNGKDDDCDGKTDEGNPGGGGTCSEGGCNGTKECKSGKLVCVSSQQSSNEICDGVDNDCNGQIDDGLERNCYDGPANTNGVGICKSGKQICIAGQWGACNGQVKPQAQEACDNGTDDNCNGQTDENCGPCTNGQTQPCYTGPAETRGVGACKNGTQTCTAGAWSTCTGEVTPQAQELCNNGIDDNCDGQSDENCNNANCTDNDKDGVGVGPGCSGTQDCNDNDPTVYPGATEVCNNGKDDDCKDGDQPCNKMAFGKVGCKVADDCESNVCANLGETYRCTQRCTSTTDCPAGYQCYQKTACWPIQSSPNSPTQPKTCQNDWACPNGQNCEKGVCTPTGCGCQQSNPSQHGAPLLLLWCLLLFLRRRPRTQNTP